MDIGALFVGLVIDAPCVGVGMHDGANRFFKSTSGFGTWTSSSFGAASVFPIQSSAFKCEGPGVKPGRRYFLVRHRPFQPGCRLFFVEVRVCKADVRVGKADDAGSGVGGSGLDLDAAVLCPGVSRRRRRDFWSPIRGWDHSYSWRGLLPRESDVFRRVNNARVALDAAFPAVRTLTMDQCLTNADSWAFFCADGAGALTDRDRIAALGSKLYADSGWSPPQKVARKVVAQAR